MLETILYTSFYFVCGFITWCAVLGENDPADDLPGETYTFAIMMGLTGPFGLVATAICTHFFRYGFRVWR